MAASRSRSHYRWSFGLTLASFTFALVIGSILWHSIATSSIGEIQMRVDRMKPMFTASRLVLIAMVAIAWPFLVGYLHGLGQIDEAQRATLRALRSRIVIWLIVIEIVLGQSLLGQVLAVLQGA